VDELYTVKGIKRDKGVRRGWGSVFIGIWSGMLNIAKWKKKRDNGKAGKGGWVWVVALNHIRDYGVASEKKEIFSIMRIVVAEIPQRVNATVTFTLPFCYNCWHLRDNTKMAVTYKWLSWNSNDHCWIITIVIFISSNSHYLPLTIHKKRALHWE
jgi:hypothetical protein